MKHIKSYQVKSKIYGFIRIVSILLLLPFLFTSCSGKEEKLTEFIPDTLDGVTSFVFNNHSMEDHFAGNWGPPVIGKDKKFSRELKEGEGRLKFEAPLKERYIIEADILSSPDKIQFKLNNKKYVLTGKNKFFGKEQINTGENELAFQFSPGIKFSCVNVFPSRITRLRNFRDLVRDQNILFIPGVMRYFVKPVPGESLLLSLDLNGVNSTNLKIEIITESKTHILTKKADNLERLRVSLIEGEFQEVRITPLDIRSPYVRIKESYLAGSRSNTSLEKGSMPENTAGKNLLIVLLDAARDDHMGYNGHLRDTTPNIDSFSKGSLIFRNCYSEASFTLASTGTLLTGLPPDFHGVISKHYSSLNKKSITLAKLFGIRDYYTGSITGNPNYGKAFNYDAGFTDFIELFEDHPVVDAGEFIEPFKKMIEKTNGDKFFIYLHIREPHDPFIMPAPFLGKFQNRFKENGKELEQFGKAFGQSYIEEGEKTELLKKIYDENLAYGDMIFGKIMSILKKNNIFDNTIIVFLSDHGEAIGENGNIGHGHVLFQPGIRIPIVMKIPGAEGKTINRQVITSDLVITIAEMFDLPFPYEKNSYGVNMFSKLQERRLFARSINIFNYPGYMVQQYPYKLITHFPFKRERTFLFDLEEDPGEKDPVKNDQLARKTLLFYLFNHLKRAEREKPDILKPNLRKSDIESLKSLGYL